MFLTLINRTENYINKLNMIWILVLYMDLRNFQKNLFIHFITQNTLLIVSQIHFYMILSLIN